MGPQRSIALNTAYIIAILIDSTDCCKDTTIASIKNTSNMAEMMKDQPSMGKIVVKKWPMKLPQGGYAELTQYKEQLPTQVRDRSGSGAELTP